MVTVIAGVRRTSETREQPARELAAEAPSFHEARALVRARVPEGWTVAYLRIGHPGHAENALRSMRS